MSKIQKELIEATGVEKKRSEDNDAFLKRLVSKTSDLDDKAWNGLSTEAQDWFNSAADAINAKQAIPEFPDEEKEEEEKPATRRRSAKEEPAETKAADPGAKVGDSVKITTKRGKEVSGKVVEIDDEMVVVEVDGEEVEHQRSRIESIVIVGGTAAKSSRRKPAEEDEPEAPKVAEPQVGDQITAVTKKGKEYSGKVIEIEDGCIVIASGDDELELDPDKLESLTIASAKSSRRKPAEEDEPKTSSRRSAKEEPEAKAKKTTAKDNGGVSATGRMRELIVEDVSASIEDIDKAMKKEGLVYKDNTLALVYADAHKIIKLLREAKKLK